MSVEEVLSAAVARHEALLAPISGGVGEDISYDDSLEAIKTEIDRPNAIEAGPTIWSTVLSISEELLTDRSKDFRVALYYGAARAEIDKLAGLFDALVFLNELCKAFWEPMYPALKRPRARGNLVGWFNDACAPIIQEAAPTAAQRPMVLALDKVFRELDSQFAEGLGEAYPGMSSMRDQLRGLVARTPAEAPPPPPPPEVTPAHSPLATSGEFPTAGAEVIPVTYDEPVSASSAGGSGGSGINVAEIYDLGTAYQALMEIAPILQRVAEVVQETNPVGADGQRLARLAGWLQIGGEPYNEGGQTMLEGPPDHIVSGLAELLAGGDFQGLATAAEEALTAYPLYLDAARMLAIAYGNLGSDYELVATVVARETSALLARGPGLGQLNFANGVPFANKDTQGWLSGLASGGGGGGGGGTKSPLERALSDMEKLLAQEQVAQAMSLLARTTSQANSPADKFRARLEIAKLAYRFQLFEIARAQLDGLERVAEEHRLAAWDLELCAEMYAYLYRVRKTAAASGYDDPLLAKQVSQSFERLCELDSSKAYEIMQEGV